MVYKQELRIVHRGRLTMMNHLMDLQKKRWNIENWGHPLVQKHVTVTFCDPPPLEIM